MVKKIVSIILLLALVGCSQINITSERPAKVSLITKSTSIDKYNNALYSNEVKSWVMPRPDPYAFSNFKAALSAFSEIEAAKLIPTHYAVSVFPKSEEEQCKLEADERLKVAYIPFNYRCVPPQISNFLDSSFERESHSLTLPHKYQERYVIINDDGEQCEYLSPINTLYIVWPISYPFPEDLDYSIDYSVFLPDSSSVDISSFVSQAEIESIKRCCYDTLGITPDFHRSSISGTVVNYDDLLDSNLAMANLMIRFQLGSSILDFYTDASGHYSAVVPDSYEMSCIYSQPRWKLTESNSTAPITKHMAYVSGLGNGIIHILSNVESTIHRAAVCYFSENHPIDVPLCNNVIRIIMTRTSPIWSGRFNAVLIGVPYIEITNSAICDSGYLFANVCHELGHYTQYYYKNNYLWYTSLHSIIKESFASYVSWIISHYYYTFVGGVDNSILPWDYYFGQSRQSWDKTNPSYYSPMFVDLYDDNNQCLSNPSYNYDSISYLPHFIIKSLATNNSNWGQIKTQLQNYIGLLISQTDYNQYIYPYDYYFAHN